MCSFFIRKLLANTYQNKAEHGPKTFFTIKISLFLHFIVPGTFKGTLISLSGVPSSVFKLLKKVGDVSVFINTEIIPRKT